MSKRYSFSNAILDQMIVGAAPGFTRDIPHREIVKALPGTTPAVESAKGRGQPVFDLFHPAMPVAGAPGLTMPALWSFKISKETRNPRNGVVTTGNMDKGTDHIGKVIAAANAGMSIPMICLNYSEDEDQWYRLEIDVAAVIRSHPPVPATGKHGIPCVLSEARRKSGGRYLVYRSLRVNFAPCVKLGLTDGWVKVDVPTLPSETTL